MPPKSAADVRKLLKKQQSERNSKQKITHPFAKYDEQGRLICIVCNSPVKNEAVWQAHLGSATHRDNIQKLKALKQQQQQQQQQQSLKRRAPSPPPPTSQQQQKRTRVEEEEEERHDIELDEEVQDSSEDEEMGGAGLPADFFDGGAEKEEIEEVEEGVQEEENGAIPAGFFDNPEEEARIQGTLLPEAQAKVDLKRDVDMFNEAMIEVTQETKQVQEEDDETFWLERHDAMSREQALLDARVEKLKHMRQAGGSGGITVEKEENDEIVVGLKSSVRQLLKSKPVKQVQSMFDDEESDSEEEEEEDWRAQQL
jgi:zinc finger protein 830